MSAPATPASFAARQRAGDLPLTGADAFLRSFDAECRRFGRASHLSQLVLRLGPGFDPERFQTTLAEAARAHPILRAPVVRRFAALYPVYRTTRPSPRLPVVSVHAPDVTGVAARSAQAPAHPALAPGVPLPALFGDRVNEILQLERGELLRVDLVPRADGGTDFAMTWAHLLFDGSGSEHFVAWLARCGDGATRVDALGADEGGGAGLDETPAAFFRALRAKGDRARAWQRQIRALASIPPRSPGGRLSRARQATRYERLTLRGDASERFLARAKEKAGVLTPVLFPLAASIRAHAALFRARGVLPRSFVVPVVANARPKGAASGAEAIFRTHVAMLWFRALAEETADLDGLVRALRTRRAELLKRHFLEDGLAALDVARIAPRRAYAFGVRRVFGGELASFFFAYTGEFLPRTATFFGAPIEDGFHVPGVPASPGSALVFSLRDGRLGVTHVWQDGVEDADERALLRRALLDDLVGSDGAGTP
ncbi:MAG TPA: hypothetical protein VMW35_20400 [Myxococcota bacterium]|nr:hypothetical protein [Myxococcota bacterium]